MARTRDERFVRYGLVTTDAPAARSFREAVVGRTGRLSAQPDIDCALTSAGGTDVAGLMATPAELRAAGRPPRRVALGAEAARQAAMRRSASMTSLPRYGFGKNRPRAGSSTSARS